MKKVRIIVSGRVQGVGFRWSARRQAMELDVNGYVRNLPNGDVEIVAEGDDAGVDRLMHWAREGPAWARIDDMTVNVLPYEAEFRDFGVRL